MGGPIINVIILLILCIYAKIDLRELAKASEALSEVEDLISSGDLLGVKLVDDSAAFLKRIGDGVRLIASAKVIKFTKETYDDRGWLQHSC